MDGQEWPHLTNSWADSVEVSITSGDIEVIFSASPIVSSTLQLSPTTSGGKIAWDCTGGNLLAKYRPSSCR